MTFAGEQRHFRLPCHCTQILGCNKCFVRRFDSCLPAIFCHCPPRDEVILSRQAQLIIWEPVPSQHTSLPDGPIQLAFIAEDRSRCDATARRLILYWDFCRKTKSTAVEVTCCDQYGQLTSCQVYQGYQWPSGWCHWDARDPSAKKIW